MSEYYTEVIRLPEAAIKHPNADTLEIWNVMGGYPCIARIGDFKGGQLAGYLSVDAILPDKPEWAFLGKNKRIKAKKLRGVFSMGLLTKESLTEDSKEGDDIGEILGITKYEPGEEGVNRSLGANPTAQAPNLRIPVSKYDIEGLRNVNYTHVIERWTRDNEQVVLTEKLHGTNCKLCYYDDKLHVGTRTRWVRETSNSVYWKGAKDSDLPTICEKHPGIVFYGEVIGVQDLKYGATNANPKLYIFDAFDSNTGRWWNYNELKEIVGHLMVPELYIGAWSHNLRDLAEGKSTIADHVREGIVVKPLIEKWDQILGREILKLAGEGYLTR